MKRTLIPLALVFVASAFGSNQPATPSDQASEASVTTKTPEGHMPRIYFKDANDSRFDEVVAGLSRERIRALCGGVRYGHFETIRDGRFAFSVAEYPAGGLALPGKIRLDREMDFYVSKERKKAIVVFFQKEKADGILVFDFSSGNWENRSNEDSETTFPAIRPVTATAPAKSNPNKP